MKFNDMTPEQFESLGEKAFSDFNLMDMFIEQNYEDFEEYMFQHSIHSDEYTDNIVYYLESRDDEYLEYAFKNYYGKK